MIGRRASGWAGWAVLLGLTALPLLVLGVQAIAVRWFFPDLVPRTLSGEQVRRVFTETRTVEAMTQGLVVGLVVGRGQARHEGEGEDDSGQGVHGGSLAGEPSTCAGHRQARTKGNGPGPRTRPAA